MYEPSLVVREAEERDVDVLAGYVLRFYRFNEEFDPAWAVARDAEAKVKDFVKGMLGDPSSIVLVAEYDGRVVGFARIQVRENSMLEAGKIGVIVELYVHPQYRRRGIAARLVDEAGRKLSERGVPVVAAEFPAANEVAEAFYRKQGFRPYTSIYLKEVG